MYKFPRKRKIIEAHKSAQNNKHVDICDIIQKLINN